MSEKTKNILIIGMSQMGKTHFGGQLYGRLKSLDRVFRLRKTPDDLSLFEEVLRQLNDGLEASHTSVQTNANIVLPIEHQDSKQHIDLIYPDYGGEQIKQMMENRKVSTHWQQQIKKTDHWFLFIRLDMMETISDITTKFYTQIEGESGVADQEKRKQKYELACPPETSAAFYVELLQIFLFFKKASLISDRKPHLTILLSCWDKMYSETEKVIPVEALQIKMPLLYNFVNNCWHSSLYQVVGLSSLGKDLSDNNDIEYQHKGPEQFGYLVLPDGKHEPDITQILNAVIS